MRPPPYLPLRFLSTSASGSALDRVLEAIDAQDAALLHSLQADSSSGEAASSSPTGACNLLLIHLAKSTEAGNLDKVGDL